MSTNKKIEANISQFKMILLDRMPFYGDIVMNLDFVEDGNIPTACTDGMKVYYNPKFMSAKPVDEQNYIYMHEIMHIILEHCSSRRKGKNHEIFNIAADIVVNSLLDSISKEFETANIPFKRPADAITDRYAGERNSVNTNLENIYEEILASNKAGNGDNKISMPNKFSRDCNPVKGWGQWELKITSKAMFNDLYEKTPVECGPDGVSVSDFVKEIVRSAIQAGEKGRSSAGSFTVPGVFLNITKKPPLNWKKLLKDYLTEVADDESSYITPERKYIHMDILLPGHGTYNEEIGDVWAFIDSSGSVSEQELDEFVTQLYHILKQFKNKLHIAYWDTQVTDIYRDIKTTEELMKAKPHSSGGTDINCVHKWIKENKIKPEIMLILTDGYFGSLLPEYQSQKLKKKTIVVLSNDLTRAENVKAVGKLAVL